jgi:hypothetical protein
MNWTPLNFGEHNGETLPQVLLADPDWFFWPQDTGLFRQSPGYECEVGIANAKATSIRTEPKWAKPLLAEYIFNAATGRCLDFDIVPPSQPRRYGAVRTMRSNVIDLSMPHLPTLHDRAGYERFLGSLKLRFFCVAAAEMSRERAEGFFNDAKNFRNNE